MSEDSPVHIIRGDKKKAIFESRRGFRIGGRGFALDRPMADRRDNVSPPQAVAKACQRAGSQGELRTRLIPPRSVRPQGGWKPEASDDQVTIACIHVENSLKPTGAEPVFRPALAGRDRLVHGGWAEGRVAEQRGLSQERSRSRAGLDTDV